MAQPRLVDEDALLRLSGRVSDHTRGAADEGDRLVTAALEVTKHHHSDQVTDVQGVCRRVDTQVSGCHLFLQLFFRAWGHVLNHPTPFKFFDKIHFI